jgi:predicted esterase
LFPLFGTADPAPTLRPGEVMDPVRCDGDPTFTYALYLPSGYRPERKWPILYAFDPRRRGRLAVELFREPAERLGFIVAGSNDTESDNPKAPNAAAVNLLLQDVERRLPIDAGRRYATGFSGGGRLAGSLGWALKGGLAGVIGCGAGFPPEQPPKRDLPFVFFGTVGDRDFNYYEVRELGATLDRLGIENRIETFEGGHEWPPADLAAEALEWMELSAMRRRVTPLREAFVEAFFTRGLERGRTLEARGLKPEAQAAYASTARDLKGVHDVTVPDAEAARLAKAGAEAETKRREKLDREAREDLARADRDLAAIASDVRPPSLASVLRDLEIAELKRQAARTDSSYEALCAARRLASIFVHASSSLPRELLERSEYRRAALALSVAAEIRPESAGVWYALARARAKGGEKKEALAALSQALEAGFSDRERLETDDDLAGIRGEEAFAALLRKLPPRDAR